MEVSVEEMLATLRGTEKVGLVGMGGVQRGAFGCGALRALQEYDLTQRFGAMAMVSCAAPAGAYALANQALVASSIHWEEAPQVFNRFSFDMDRLMQAPVAGPKVLHTKAMIASPVDFFVGVTDYETGIGALLDVKHSPGGPLAPIRASMSMPLLCDPVQIGGRQYCDGMTGMALPVRELAEQTGIKNFLIITNHEQEDEKGEQRWYEYLLYASKLPHGLSRAIVARHERLNERWQWLRKQDDIRWAALMGCNGLSMFERNPSKLQKAEYTGFHAVADLLPWV
jgi:predicted patatin/cPLA2 family phospholipase